MAAAAAMPQDAPHIPVLIRPLIEAVSPVSGLWLDGTFGAGGYTRALFEAGADRVIGVDRDPVALAAADRIAKAYGERLKLVEGTFSRLDDYADAPLDGVVLDLGVSSMQIDQPERGFSFQKDGPLDMRMGRRGDSAADLVANLSEGQLADVIYLYGEERASRRIARAIVQERAESPITTTLRLAGIVSRCLPRPKPGQSHPATRTFQALRIAVNNEYGELWQGLMAAERALKPGGHLAVVTFHSVEDRMTKRFLQLRSDTGGGGNRHAPEVEVADPGFALVTKKAIEAEAEELAANPRSRSARLRVARRTAAPARPVTPADIAMPKMKDAR